MFDALYSEASDFGEIRKNNEFAVGSFPPSLHQHVGPKVYLFAFADRVGGLYLGEVDLSRAVFGAHGGVRQCPGWHYAH